MLSDSHEIAVHYSNGAPLVLFFTFRGWLDSYSGFLHVSPGGNPKDFDNFDERGSRLLPLDKDWYFVSHP